MKRWAARLSVAVALALVGVLAFNFFADARRAEELLASERARSTRLEANQVATLDSLAALVAQTGVLTAQTTELLAEVKALREETMRQRRRIRRLARFIRESGLEVPPSFRRRSAERHTGGTEGRPDPPPPPPPPDCVVIVGTICVEGGM